MPWILNAMANLANGTAFKKFSPLMMNPISSMKIAEGYPISHEIMEHEGRHRALAAVLLNIPKVPVAIMTITTNEMQLRL